MLRYGVCIDWVWLFLNDATVYARQGVTTNQCFRIGVHWGRVVVKNTIGHFPGGPRGGIAQHASCRKYLTRPVWSVKTSSSSCSRPVLLS
jgi:hypothetical protein